MASCAHRSAAARAGLAELGVRRGDRVVALAPNSPQTLVAFLAAASLGAIWSSCSPDFGVRAVADRFTQIEPTVLIAVDGYVYNGRAFDVRPDRGAAAGRSCPRCAATVLIALPRPRTRPWPARDPVAASSTGTPGPSWRSTRCRSTIRCGCCTRPAPPGCPRESCRGTAGSCWST